jgi:histidinol-phosphatase (PHP family)
LFDIIGHADLPKKFGHRPARDCSGLEEPFLRAARAHQCAVELNTAGLRKECREIYPGRELLQRAFQQGVPITFGSDAHAPEEVGMNFAEAVQLARETGYHQGCRFAARQRRMVAF